MNIPSVINKQLMHPHPKNKMFTNIHKLQLHLTQSNITTLKNELNHLNSQFKELERKKEKKLCRKYTINKEISYHLNILSVLKYSKKNTT